MPLKEVKNAIDKAFDSTIKLKEHNVPNETILNIISNDITNQEIDKCIIDDSTLFRKVMDYHIKYFENKSSDKEFVEILKSLTDDFITKKLNKNHDYIREKLVHFNSVIFNFFEGNYIYNELYKLNKNDILIPQEKAPELLSTFNPRINQEDVFNKLEMEGLQTGIHCQATGCGKSFIIIRYIDYVFRKFKEKSKIILFTERVNILRDLFGFTKNNIKPDDKMIQHWKNIGVGDLTPFKIINCVTKKDRNWHNHLNEDGPVLIVINRAYLTSSKYSSINNLSLILHDECHNTTSEKCNKFLEELKITGIL